MQDSILSNVIFSPAQLALDLVNGLVELGNDVLLYTPGMVKTNAKNVIADLSLFEQELAGRGDDYIDLLKKHPGTFISLARQVQAEIIARAYTDANDDKLDVVHIYTNEEDIALPFADLCNKPVVFTHHDPFNFLVKYKNNFPKYKHLNWIALSESQKKGMPADTNWLATIHHGIPEDRFVPEYQPKGGYVAFLGRIIEPKGVHLAIQAVKQYNTSYGTDLKLKIAGKHYSGHKKDVYWTEVIEPQLGDDIEYVGYISNDEDKQKFLGNAEALLIPSVFEEPFGIVMIESLACGTPVIGLKSGAIPEVIENEKTGFLVEKSEDPAVTVTNIVDTFDRISTINRRDCRKSFEELFTSKRMRDEYLKAYQQVLLKDN